MLAIRAVDSFAKRQRHLEGWRGVVAIHYSQAFECVHGRECVRVGIVPRVRWAPFGFGSIVTGYLANSYVGPVNAVHSEITGPFGGSGSEKAEGTPGPAGDADVKVTAVGANVCPDCKCLRRKGLRSGRAAMVAPVGRSYYSGRYLVD